MSAKALLEVNPQPTLKEIKEALKNNLCRCTGYVPIFEAIQLATKQIAAGREEEQSFSLPAPDKLVGAAVARRDKDAVGLVTGATKFAHDIVMEGMLYGKILWSSEPHAEIVRIETSAAEKIDGVVQVVTAKDVRGTNRIGILTRDQPAIADKKVRSIGDSLAAVFAESEEIAAAAVEKIRVKYRSLPGVFSPKAASDPNAPLVHEEGNLLSRTRIERGDVNAAFGECAVVVEESFTTPAIEHAFAATEAGVAIPTQGGGVTIKIGTQSAFDDRKQLSEALGLPQEKIRIVELPIGGAFGGKDDLIIHQYLALGALLTQRPVKIVLDRQESIRSHPKRHPAWMHFKTGADSAGRILALQAHIEIDAGAYASLSADILCNTVVFASGPYYVPHVRVEGEAWYTNNIQNGAMRGFGVPQVEFALEQMVDRMARDLGKDPFAFRMINALEDGSVTASDHVLETGVAGVKSTLEAAQEALAKTSIPEGKGKFRVGIGVACGVKNVGYGHGILESAGAIVTMDGSGCVTLKVSQHEHGHGAHTTLMLLAASELGLPLDRIDVVGVDTAVTPPTGPTTASRQTYVTGNAVLMACKALKNDIITRATGALGGEKENIVIAKGNVKDTVTGNEIPLSELGAPFTAERRYVPAPTAPLTKHLSLHGEPQFSSRRTHYAYGYSTHVAIVEINTETGDARVLKVLAAHDVGRVLNRIAVHGQIAGGVVMGLGYALKEELVLDHGFNLTDSLKKCNIPTAMDVPEIIPIITEVPHPDGPYGAKGLGEMPMLAIAPAIANAIYDAVGVRINSLPATNRRVLAEIVKQAGRGEGSDIAT